MGLQELTWLKFLLDVFSDAESPLLRQIPAVLRSLVRVVK